MTVLEKLAALRERMRQEKLDAYVVPGNDPHASEYLPTHWHEMNWLSGFKGESGTVVVTMTEALLWTDSRYYLQADIELRDSTIGLMRESDIDCPSIIDWLRAKGEGLTVGVNPEMFSVNDFADWKSQLTLRSIDLVRSIWTEDRPAIPQDKLYPYSADFAGESVESKLARMREKIANSQQLTANSHYALIISALDEIAWLLNIRGNDVAFNPVVVSFVVLEHDKCTLFVLPEKVDTVAQNYLDFNSIDVRGYEQVYDYIRGLSGIVFFDGARVNEALYEAIPADCKKVNTKSPILIDKAKKNAIELEGERIAMRQDSAALTRFFRWLETEAFADGKTQTECDLMNKLHEFRLMGENFVEESFGTIAGYQGNGAIVHYEATPEKCATVHPKGMLLLDSGGQYLDGTTDITRTTWLGKVSDRDNTIPEQAKLDYTYVLKGHIALATICFPRGTRGNQLDALAKQYMWQAGITFGHGTGHGVGHFLGCHEGPQNVRTDNNPTPLEVGHIISDEPGIYRTGQWGIRTENLITVIPAERKEACTTEDRFLQFETLTLCFYDTRLIEMSLMTEQEIAWINAYHERVYKETAPLLNEQEREYLRKKCEPLSL
ncbi:MAG: aminopeptidase P family N-terminal domain-containing protein [Paludibacteraceae bacterium]|nr:aminopeptidase P family N-terminal domain-containing protein [Paludibacteraceae bacterium]